MSVSRRAVDNITAAPVLVTTNLVEHHKMTSGLIEVVLDAVENKQHPPPAVVESLRTAWALYDDTFWTMRDV